MSAWAALAEAHGEGRWLEGSPEKGMRRRIASAADAGLLPPEAPSVFRAETRHLGPGKKQVALQLGPDLGVRLTVDRLAEGSLQAQLLLERRASRWLLRELTLTLLGRTHGDAPVYLAVHLPDVERDGGRDGTGACGHPVLHAHAGRTHGDPLEVRVPLPVLPPEALLDWIVTQVHPAWEPAPWPKGE